MASGAVGCVLRMGDSVACRGRSRGVEAGCAGVCRRDQLPEGGSGRLPGMPAASVAQASVGGKSCDLRSWVYDTCLGASVSTVPSHPVSQLISGDKMWF